MCRTLHYRKRMLVGPVVEGSAACAQEALLHTDTG
jgi:hypothetical protein